MRDDEIFSHFISSIFSVEWYDGPGRPGEECYHISTSVGELTLTLASSEGGIMELGKAHLQRIEMSLPELDKLAYAIVCEGCKDEPEINVEEDLSLAALKIYDDGTFLLGYAVLDDGNNLHLYVEFDRRFVPGKEVYGESY